MYTAQKNRYSEMKYNRCGNSGIKLPAISLGLWHNFGSVDSFENSKSILLHAFDNGITHFDLANNYGPEPGSAESTFGQVISKDLKAYRDEIIISTKAGYYMWEGPYGEWGSKKNLFASLHQSLKRMRLDYVDIFYSHRFDPETPLEETMMALDQIVKQGKALYVGISNYTAEDTQKAVTILKELGTPCLIHQPRYHIFDRWVENGLLDCLEENGVGAIAFSPLAQGLLTNRYIKEIPTDSRMAREGFLKTSMLTHTKISSITELNKMALDRGQTLAQMAISWLLKDNRITSVLVGASSKNQLSDSLKSLQNLQFSTEEIKKIDDLAFPVIAEMKATNSR